MPLTIRTTVRGADRVIRNLRVLGSSMPEALGRALFRWAEADITAVAKDDYVPVMFGALKSSIRTMPPVVTSRRVTVSVVAGGAAAPYALSVHENPRSGRTGGYSPSGRRYKNWARTGTWKYLELPAQLAAGDGRGLAREAGIELQRVIDGLSR